MKKGFILSFGKKIIDFSFSLSKAFLFAVENEIKISPDPLDRAARTEMARVVDPMSAMAFYSSAFRAAVRQARGTTRQRLRAKGRVV